MRRLTARAASICAATAVAGAVTAANRAGWLDISHLAATPRAVAEGELWRLLTSGVIAERTPCFITTRLSRNPLARAVRM